MPEIRYKPLRGIGKAPRPPLGTLNTENCFKYPLLQQGDSSFLKPGPVEITIYQALELEEHCVKHIVIYVLRYDPSGQPYEALEESWEEVPEQDAKREVVAAGFEIPSAPVQRDNPVICSQAAIARMLGRSENTSGLVRKLQDEGIIRYFEPPEKKGGKFKVWFTDPAQHERALKESSGKPSRRRPKVRKS
jgi:hypothetical protein